MATYIPKLPDPARFADSSGTINTTGGYRPSLFEDPGRFAANKAESLFNMPSSFSLGNALQMGSRALGPFGTLASGAMGLLGIGTGRTGNPIVDQFATPAFGLGMPAPSRSETLTNPGATAFGPEVYGQQPSLFPQNTRTLQPANIQPRELSAAEKSLLGAYSLGSKYDTTGKGWVADPSRNAPQTSMAAPSAGSASSGNGGGWAGPWYANQPDPYSLTGNMLDRISYADFGSGRYENASNPFSSLWGSDSGDLPMFGPGARYVQGNKFDTN